MNPCAQNRQRLHRFAGLGYVRASINHNREIDMRCLVLIAAAVVAFGGAMTVQSRGANAVVCANGVYRAGCAGARGAVVVRKPVASCRWVWVGGVKVRKCG